MAAPIVIPFDNNPASTSIKTTSYTIPAGKYARVQNLHGDLLIDTVPHYVVIQSFSRVHSITSVVINTLTPTNDCNLIICTSLSTVSNASNSCSANPGSLHVITGAVGSTYLAMSGNINTGVSSLYYDNDTFTTLRKNYIFPLTNYSAVAAATFTPAALNYGIGGAVFYTQRTSGTVTHTGAAVKFSSNEFWVASGTVLDGVKYSVTEYNVIS